MSQIANDFFWRTISPPLNPFIQASITQTYGYGSDVKNATLITTTAGNTRLSVTPGSLLILTCLASYPVSWSWSKDSDHEPIAHQKRKSDDFLDQLVARSIDDTAVNGTTFLSTDRIFPIEQYKTDLELRNIDNGKGGVYSCRGMLGLTMSTLVKLEINSASNLITRQTLKGAKIIQEGFNDIVQPNSSQISASVIYYIPVDSGAVAYIEKDRISDYDNSKNRNYSTETKKIAAGFWQTTFKVLNAHYEKAYHFSIKTKNQTEVAESMWNLRTEKIDSILADRREHGSRTYLTLGGYYEIILRATKASYEDIKESHMDFLLRVPNEHGCEYVHSTLEMAVKKCGIIAVSKYKEPKTFGIKIILKAIDSCKIRYHYKFDFWNKIFTSSELDVIVVDDPELAKGYPKIQPIYPYLHDDRLYVNDSFTLRCILPRCDFWARISWTRRGSPPGTSVRADQNGHYDDILFAPTHAQIIPYYRKLNHYTISLDLYFKSLQPIHSDRYTCEKINEKPTSIDYNNRYDLDVQRSPRPLKNRDGINTYTNWIEGSGLISCNIIGEPEPNITWYRMMPPKAMQPIGTGWRITVNETGMYQCVASNRHGIAAQIHNITITRTHFKDRIHYENRTQINEKIKDDWINASILPIAIALPSVAAVTFCLIFLLLWRRKRERAALFQEFAAALKSQRYTQFYIDPEIPLNDQVDLIPYSENYEIDFSLVTIKRYLAEGNFGQVCQGELKNQQNDEVKVVAVKKPKNFSNIEQYHSLMDEVKIMTRIPTHVNVISLIGACTSNIERFRLYVLLEFCEHGSLEDYLMNNWAQFQSQNSFGETIINFLPLISYAYQAANGIEHLAIHHIIHRDLALRNLLLTIDHVVKVSDFGLSRQHPKGYKIRRQDIPLPIKWMAPEAISSYTFTQKSDVWSFGILLWELFSGGRMPYEGVTRSVQSLFEFISNGYRLEKPSVATDEIYALMQDCWKWDATDRPTISECKRRIGEHLEEASPGTYRSTLRILSNAMSRSFSSISQLSYCNHRAADRQIDRDETANNHIGSEVTTNRRDITHDQSEVDASIEHENAELENEAVEHDYLIPNNRQVVPFPERNSAGAASYVLWSDLNYRL